jgi:hypothetical protein
VADQRLAQWLVDVLVLLHVALLPLLLVLLVLLVAPLPPLPVLLQHLEVCPHQDQYPLHVLLPLLLLVLLPLLVLLLPPLLVLPPLHVFALK